MKKERDIFGEIMEGIDSMRRHREGTITLRTHEIEEKPLPRIDPELILETRECLNLSRSVFARRLRVSQRTLEKWEQGRSRPNDQATALILMVRKYPDTIDRLAELS